VTVVSAIVHPIIWLEANHTQNAERVSGDDFGWAGVRGLPDWPYDSLNVILLDEGTLGTAGLALEKLFNVASERPAGFWPSMPLVPAQAALADPLFTHKPFLQTME